MTNTNNEMNKDKINKNSKIFMLDNLDSFTYNLVDEFQVLGFDPIIYRNTLSADFILQKIAEYTENEDCQVIIVLSPGPGSPSEAGCLMELISKAAGKYPMLGICLGHQALIQYYGGTIARAPEIVHGKSSDITHNEQGAFTNISNPLPVARYHSLVATAMPEQLELIAYVNYVNIDNGEITKLPMAIEYQQDAILGFQFHPESILTTYGSTLLAQSLRQLSTLASAKNMLSGQAKTEKILQGKSS